MRKINLKANANAIVQRECDKKEFIALQKQLEEGKQKNFQTQFGTAFQSLVTKLGLIMSEAVETGPKMKRNTYLEAVDYLAKVLNDPQVSQVLRGLGINDAANHVKHSLKKINITVSMAFAVYNGVCDQLATNLKIPQFKKAKIKEISGTGGKKQAVSIFEETKKKSVRYEIVGGNRIQIRLSPKYSIDPYQKTAKTTLNLFWEAKNEDELRVTVVAVGKNGTKRKISEGTRFDLQKANRGNFGIRLNENEVLEGNIIKLEIELSVYRWKTITYTKEKKIKTGFLFFKKTQRIPIECQKRKQVCVDSLNIQISQKLREEDKAP